MKKLIYLVLIFFVCSFAACKKSEEKPAEGKQQAAKTKQKGNKRQKGKGGRPQALQIYREDKLVVAIPVEEYAKMMNATVKVDGKEHKAMLLTDLLKAHNVTGKNVILKGPNRSGSMTWEEVIDTPVYIYPVKNRLQIHHENEALRDKKIPIVLVRIDVAEEPVTTATKKGGKKPST
jgi:hypothetical protein